MKKIALITLVLLTLISTGFSAELCTPGNPYHVKRPDGRCVWSCSQGTQPDFVLPYLEAQCICKAGFQETSKDQFTRKICTPYPQGSQPLFKGGPQISNTPKI